MKTQWIRLLVCVAVVIALCGYTGIQYSEEEPPAAIITEIPAAPSPQFVNEIPQIQEVDEIAEEPPEEPPASLLIPSRLTAAELESGLLYELKPLAPLFIEAEEETGINAVFLAAVAINR